MRFPLRPLTAVLALALLAACGGGGGGGGGTVGCAGLPAPVSGCSADAGGACVAGPGTPMTVSGTISFERLRLRTTGLGPDLEVRPARFVDVEVHVAGTPTCYGAGTTDAAGAYSIVVAPPDGASLEVIAWSRTDDSPTVHVTVHHGLAPSVNAHCNGDVFRHPSAPFPAGADRVVDVTVPYDDCPTYRPAIGFGVLDVLTTVSETIRTAVGVTPPIVHAYTQLGNNGLVGTSYYDTGANAITILGGAAGNLDGSDTDYFDDGVLAHEYHHFVEFALAHSLNRGGPHGGEDLEPPFAWSEGACTAFGCVARGTSYYVDTRGTGGTLLYGVDVENILQQFRGIGSEETVAEVVWDLADGGLGPTDADGDGATVVVGGLYQGLLSFDPATDAPFLGLFLDRLVGAVQVTAPQLAALALFPENQQFTYPMTGDDVFPTPLPVPGTRSGTVDSRAGPDVNQCRGRASSAWFVIDLAAAETIDLALDIQPIPGVANANLDLSLLSMAGNVLRRDGHGGNTDESILGAALPAGRYLVLVEASCVGAGNAADFAVTVN